MMLKLNAHKLWTAAQFQSTEETRYYLCGVHIERAADGVGAILVATDGRRMAVVYDGDAEVGDKLPEEGVILATPKPMLAALKRRKAANVSVGADGTVVVGDVADAVTYISPSDLRIDGTFPDWRRVLPKEPNGDMGVCWNASYLGGFAALHGPGTREQVIALQPNGGGPARILVPGKHDRFGILMPIHGEPAKLPDPYLTSWFTR